MTKLVFDLEAPGLYEAKHLWCIATHDLTLGTQHFYGPDQLSHGLKALAEATMLIGHNIAGFDLPLIEKLYPTWMTNAKIRDTLCMSKMFLPARNKHSLATYGTQFGREKPEHEDWYTWSDEMGHRCREDVQISLLTYRYLVDKECKDWDWVDALELEQEFAADQCLQEAAGIDIDVVEAKRLITVIDEEVDLLSETLLAQMPKRVVKHGASVSKPFKMDRSYSKMVTDWMDVIHSTA